MAEYYPLLAKAIGSLPNSTPDSRRVVYERARKALIGQLRTLHPPVPDEDIERESVELDRAVERLEAEIANGAAPAPPPPPATPAPPTPPAPQTPPAPPATPPGPPADSKTAGNGGSSSAPVLRPRPPLPERKPFPPRPPAKPAVSKPALPAAPVLPGKLTPPQDAAVPPPGRAGGDIPAQLTESSQGAPQTDAPPIGPGGSDEARRLKPPQRPIAPQPSAAAAPKRRLWIIPVVVAVVVAVVAAAAWKLRDHPAALARKPADQTQTESGKIAERVGEPASQTSPSESKDEPATPSTEPQQSAADKPSQGRAPANPELPVARRAALLVEAPNEASKVKTFVGSVVWKLNNAPQGANAAVGLAVEADIDLPDDKMKAVVTFEKNSDPSLPASHTIKVRFIVEPGSFSGGVKQISVPQMRPEASPNGEPLAGVTVQIVPNSFLVGLSPGNAEAANTDLMRRLQWVDIPMLLDNGKIAKLTFEKGESGQRDLNEAFEAWQK